MYAIRSYYDAQAARLERLVLARLADIDPAQGDRRRRQDAGIDRTAHAHRHADQAARLRFEGRAVAVPIGKQGTDQRRDQRQDQCNGQTEQCGLHGVITSYSIHYTKLYECRVKQIFRFIGLSPVRDRGKKRAIGFQDHPL